MNHVDNPFQSPAIISFCPGILGLERGLERVLGQLRVLAYSEIEAFICANLVAGMESGILAPAPIWTDAKTFPAEGFRGKVHGIIGGYPCQPFSTAGKRKGEEDPRHLWPHIRRHIDTIRPVWCFFENVAGHLSLGFDQVYKELAEMGYRVEAGIFTAEEVGAPHRRERLFFLAISDTARKQNWRIQQPGLQANSGAGCIELENTNFAIIRNNYGKNRGRDGRQTIRQENGQECAIWPGTAGENAQLVNPSLIPQQKQTNETNTITDGGKAWQKLSQRCNELAYTDSERGQLQITRELATIKLSEWPASPGCPQYLWEEPRTIESPLGRNANGNPNGNDIVYVNEVYEAYTTKKTGSIKVLSELWTIIESKANEWTVGRLFCFLEKEILFSRLYGAIQETGLTVSVSSGKIIPTDEKRALRNVWIDQAVGSTPQGQEYIKQLRREFANAMCVLSYQIALAGRQETKSGGEFETMQYLRENYKDAWWNVPETLYPIQETWRPVSEKENWQIHLERAYKGYRLELFGTLFGYNFREDLLRALGNSVVEQTAELAFRTLLAKHLNNLK